MEIVILILVGFIGLAALVALILTYRRLESLRETKEDSNLLLILQTQMQNLSKTMDEKLTETHRSMSETQIHIHKTLQDQFTHNSNLIQGITGQSTKMIQEITEKLTNLDKTNQQVVGFSEQLSNLEKVLTHQKQRGTLGEAGLQLILENILPPTNFKMQYQFADGDVVDAAIFCKEGIIPVDSKFSLDNYNRLTHEENPGKKIELEKEFKADLKKRIDETSKYIKPKEGTLEFAFMFIPAEGIYYDLLINEVGTVKANTRSLLDYAFKEKKVIVVSPTTFAAYLMTVLQGLRALQIEEGTKSIRKNVEELQKHILVYDEFMKKLGGNLSTTVNQYNNAYKEFGKIDKDIVRIIGGEKEIEPLLLDKPIFNE